MQACQMVPSAVLDLLQACLVVMPLRRYDVVDPKIKKKTQREVTQLVLSRPSKMCNFIEWKDQKIIFKRLVSFVDCSHI